MSSVFNFSSKQYSSSGSALITLLVIVAVGLIVTSSAVVVAVTNSQTTSQLSRSDEVLAVAEAGAEEAILRILRNPSYSGGTMTVGSGTATMAVTGTGGTTPVITSKGQVGSIIRTVQVQTNWTNSVLTVTSWQEI